MFVAWKIDKWDEIKLICLLFHRANFMGTHFTIFDGGLAPEKPGALPDASNVRNELAVVYYVSNRHVITHNSLTHSERRPQNIYSQEEINLYCIIKSATEISLFSLQISKTWCVV